MALTLTEELLRRRVNLTHDNLEDVKSLSLPGTYHDKIRSVGHSLRKFTHLKSLDLSRNALDTLEGLENLERLETLNLYYNNIDSLEQMKRLQRNTNLRELDLRLNPVTRSEPDLRLHLIHMLPSLQKLDDRSVRDRERQAALIHFSSSQATEMTHHRPRNDTPERQPHPRVELVNKVTKAPLVFDDDDVAVLDLIAHSGGDLSQGRPLTGSAAKADKAEEYTLEGLRSLNSNAVDLSQLTRDLELEEENEGRTGAPRETKEVISSYKKRYPNIASAQATDNGTREDHQKRPDANFEYHDEMEAYTKYRSHGYFTPHPGQDPGELEVSQVPTERDPYPEAPRISQHCDEEPEEARQKNITRKMQDTHRAEVHGVGTRLANNPHGRESLVQLLNLVDKYWNGSKSLHNNAKFLGLALTVIEKLMVASESERRVFPERYQDIHGEHIRGRDNRYPIQEREDQPSRVTAGHSDTSINQTQLDDLQRQNKALLQEVEGLRDRVKQFSQMQELSSMLQESHKSLVETNDRLLKDLNETQQRHTEEVKQLHWSYDQLKKTMSYLPSPNTSTSRLARDLDIGVQPGIL